MDEIEDIESLPNDVPTLHSLIKKLVEEIKENEQKVITAAEYGQHLLEKNAQITESFSQYQEQVCEKRSFQV